MMQDRTITLSRPLVGSIALVCLATWGGLLLFKSKIELGNVEMWAAVFGNMGLLTLALAIALPGKGREAAWAKVSPKTFAIIVLSMVSIAWRPRIAIPLLLILGFATWVIKPKTKHRPPRN